MVSDKMLKLGSNSSCIREIAEFGDIRKKEIGEENVFDFSLGNPNVPIPKKVTDELCLLSKEEDIHSYTPSIGNRDVIKKITSYMSETYDFKFDEKLLFMTCGAASSLTIVFHALFEENDELLAIAPFFPEYRVFAEEAGFDFKYVLSDLSDFQIDENLLKNAISEKTKCVIINSPNNPTGVILNEKSIVKIKNVLEEKEKEYGHPIFLISDEPYREIAFDNITVPFVPKYYKNTIICYSFSKSLSLPGERIGYILVSPECILPNDIFTAIKGSAHALGFVCAPSIFQKLVGNVIGTTVDISIYEKNRNILYGHLTKIGFEVVHPDGAFYMFMKVPNKDAKEFAEIAKEFEILVVPSDDFGCPGYVRIAYCTTKEKIEKSLPAWTMLAKRVFKE